MLNLSKGRAQVCGLDCHLHARILRLLRGMAGHATAPLSYEVCNDHFRLINWFTWLDMCGLLNQVAMEKGARRQAVGCAPRRPHQREGHDRVQDQSWGPPHLGILSRQGRVHLLPNVITLKFIKELSASLPFKQCAYISPCSSLKVPKKYIEYLN